MCNNSVQNSSYCGVYALSDVTSNEQFARDNAPAISANAEDFDYPKEIYKIPSLKMLLTFAEKEFEKTFSKFPTYAAYAPACINLYGESTDFNDGKVLSMATQLVTVIVGTRRATSRRCKVKTLTREIGEENYSEFCIGSSDLDISEGITWPNYIKSVISSFSIPKEQIPGFKALIVSSIPIKCGLGSSVALTVATYTFLEAITNVHTLNILEKSIACKQAEQICTQVPSSIGEILISISGIESKVMQFDPRSLQIKEHNWNMFEIDLVLINSTLETIDTLIYQKYLNQCREVAFAFNITSLRSATIPKLLMIDPLVSPMLIERCRHIIKETSRVTEAVELIKQCHWKQLGKLMWQSHCSMRDHFGSSCMQIEYIMNVIQNINGVYGARIIGRGFGGFVLVMVHRRAVKEMVKALSNVIECQEYRVIKPSSGATILYTNANDQSLRNGTRTGNVKIAHRHHLAIDDHEKNEPHRDNIYEVRFDKAFIPLKAMYI